MGCAVTVFFITVQKQEKPKFVLCVTFSENGDTITGDSSGNILVWGKGKTRLKLIVIFYYKRLDFYINIISF